MLETTKEQVLEYLEQTIRDLKSGRLTKEDVQALITKPKHEPKKRLVRSLLKRAQKAIDHIDPHDYGLRQEAISELAIAYFSAGQKDLGKKIIFRIQQNTSKIAETCLAIVQILCEKNEIQEARELAKCVYGMPASALAEFAIAQQTADENDHPMPQKFLHLSTNYAWDTEIALAIAWAKTDHGSTLEQLRNHIEKNEARGYGNTRYWEVSAALAKEYARQDQLVSSRTIMQSLPDLNIRFHVALAIANASKHENDFSMCRSIIGQLPDTPAYRVPNHLYACDLCKIAALTGQERDFQACRDAIEKLGFGREQSYGYSALAIAYGMQNDIPAARQLVNQIVYPFCEAKALIGIARAVLANQE